MRIYFDNCCLNRPYDDLSNHSVYLESEAVLAIIDICKAGEWVYLSSDILYDEISEMPDKDRMERIMLLYNSAQEHIRFTEQIYLRAKQFETYNIKSYDALHLASAEAAKADVLLTTDRRFINVAKRTDSQVPVNNPLSWLSEVFYDRKF
jgi:predicted nucleic acid-binding protein